MESATFMVEHWVIDPSMLASCNPFLVSQLIFYRLGNNSSKDSGSVVSSQAYHHNTYLSGVLGSLELIRGCYRFWR
jgi:hypothetical protein